MLLWEIAELKIPYEDEIDPSRILYKITKEQCREKFSNGGVPQEWKNLVKATWNHNPKYRPSFTDIFKIIQELSERNFNLLDINANQTDEFHSQEFDSFFDFDEMMICLLKKLSMNIIKIMPESERKVHKKQATQLFKEAADSDIVEAQLMYGDCMFNGMGASKNTIKVVEYYKMAADNDNPDAMYKVGNIYYHGDSVEKDLVIGEKFLRLAAYNQQKQAIDICKKYGIEL
ncbi:9165_t:CDS:2 [Gigaspora margarita]|uniref:9165_t:CDS:1 n=1 Tax=Gigaspora margarita TaxID=4874 RepID=A0ABN7WBZ6_GIGMA|nr:9165_t:CDS:2 [Gigaspora margarita]